MTPIDHFARRVFEVRREERARTEATVRASAVGTGDRSERIRTYNFPQVKRDGCPRFVFLAVHACVVTVMYLLSNLRHRVLFPYYYIPLLVCYKVQPGRVCRAVVLLVLYAFHGQYFVDRGRLTSMWHFVCVCVFLFLRA